MTLALTAKACLFMKNEAGLLTCNSWYHLPALAVAYLIQPLTLLTVARQFVIYTRFPINLR